MGKPGKDTATEQQQQHRKEMGYSHKRKETSWTVKLELQVGSREMFMLIPVFLDKKYKTETKSTVTAQSTKSNKEIENNT